MSQVASLNAAERGFGFGPAQASRGARAPAGLIGAAAFAAALVLLPILVTIVQAAGVDRARRGCDLLIRPLVGRLLVNTVGLVVAASVTCAVIGTATAWLVERTDLPGRKVWAVLAVAPLAIPPFISSYAWVSLSNGLQDFGGALLVVTCAYYPLVYLPVAAALRGLDPGLEETARSLGHGPWRCFFRVVAPQLRPALLRRRIAGRARCPDRVRRLRAAALPHFHHRALRPIPDGTGRAGILAAGARAHRPLSRLRGRRTEGARPGALRARRLRRATRRSARRVSDGSAGRRWRRSRR